jgi:hypothetical protein
LKQAQKLLEMVSKRRRFGEEHIGKLNPHEWPALNVYRFFLNLTGHRPQKVIAFPPESLDLCPF